MPPKIDLVECDPILTAVVRGRVPRTELPRFIPAACGEVWSFARSAELPRPGRHIALYLDDQGTVEVGVEVKEPFAGTERIHCSRIPGGRTVTAAHFGPYPSLGATHLAIQQWCGRNNLQLAGIAWEIYGHWEESWNTDPAKIRTNIFYLLDEDGR